MSYYAEHGSRSDLLNCPPVNRAVTGLPERSIQKPSASVAVGGVVKRTLDVVLAGSLLVLLSPLMTLVALLVLMTSRGPAFYGHERIGHRGQEFRCLKFRTMYSDGDRLFRDYLAQNADASREWEQTRKLQKDPRVTPLGHVLREYSVDELPQLLNVLLGHMSLIGPRPVVEHELQLYGPSARYYLSARPGLSGIWQVSGRNDVSYRRRVAMDRAYVSRWSPLLDVRLMLSTIPAVLGARGSY